MIENYSNSLMMSDSLKGMLPDLEDQGIEKYEESFLITVLYLDDSQDQLVGSLVGASFEEIFKLDVKVKIKDAFDFLKRSQKEKVSLQCLCVELRLGSENLRLDGPYKFSNAKILDFDHQNSSCVLAIDLIRC